MKLNNYCDFGHEKSCDVRVLPLSGSENHGNVIVCPRHRQKLGSGATHNGKTRIASSCVGDLENTQ